MIAAADRTRIAALLEFWFGDDNSYRREWFQPDPAFDEELRDRFEGNQRRAAAGRYDAWLDDPRASLALVLLLDQLPRNLYRGMKDAFASDEMARQAANTAIALGHDRRIVPTRRLFFYLPFMHSEDIADQERACELIADLPPSWEAYGDALSSARAHREMIRRFGRFPHRNKALGRETTPLESEFLKTSGSSF